MIDPEIEHGWEVKFIERRGPFFFESWAIAILSLAINVLATLALSRSTSNGSDGPAIFPCMLLFVAAIVSYIYSMKLWRRLDKIFRDKPAPKGRMEEISKMRHFNLRIYGWLISTSLCALLIVSFVFNWWGHLSFFQSEKKPSKIVIGYQEIALYRHLFTAVEKGYFNNEGLTVQIKPFVSANQMIEGMIAGELDGTGLTNLQVALTVEAKDPKKLEFVNMLVWGKDTYPDYILVRPDANINSLKDLEGHIVGLHPGSAVKAFSKAICQNSGVNLNKVSFIELDPAIMQSAILAKRVDALYCMDPVATNLISCNQAKILLKNPMQYIFSPPVPISGTAFSKKFLQERPNDARRVIRAIEKAIKYMREPGHEDEIAGYIAKYSPITPELSKKMNISEYWTASEIDHERIQALSDKFFELGIVDKAVDVSSILITPDFLK